MPEHCRVGSLAKALGHMSSPAPTRPSLLLQIRDRRDERAWEDFVGIYAPLIHGFCRQRGLQDSDAADVAQEVLRAVAQSVDRFEYDPARGKFRSWLLTITRNKFNNFLASQMNRPGLAAGTTEMLQIPETPSPVEADAWEKDVQRRLYKWAAEKVRQEVKPSSWQAFQATAVEGRSGEQVAAELGMTAGAVYVARSRVTARLRHWIESVGDAEPGGETSWA